MFEGKYNNRSETPFLPSNVLKSCVKNWFDGAVFQNAVIMLYLFVVFLFTGNFPMLYCCKDCKNVIRDKKSLQSSFSGLCKLPPEM